MLLLVLYLRFRMPKDKKGQFFFNIRLLHRDYQTRNDSYLNVGMAMASAVDTLISL